MSLSGELVATDHHRRFWYRRGRGANLYQRRAMEHGLTRRCTSRGENLVRIDRGRDIEHQVRSAASSHPWVTAVVPEVCMMIREVVRADSDRVRRRCVLEGIGIGPDAARLGFEAEENPSRPEPDGRRRGGAAAVPSGPARSAPRRRTLVEDCPAARSSLSQVFSGTITPPSSGHGTSQRR